MNAPSRRFRPLSLGILSLLFALASELLHTEAVAAQLEPETIQAWDRYIQWADKKIESELASPQTFLIQDNLSPEERSSVKRSLEAGNVVVQRVRNVVPPGVSFDVPGGEIHHWWGSILIRGTTLPKLLGFLQDYDHHAGKFADVEKSRLISKTGNQFSFYLRLRRSQSFVTAYYNTQHDCTYRIWSPKLVSSHSIATRIAEIEDPGKSTERESPPGNDRGFLWRLVSWWRLEETPTGIIVELESASLSRDIPALVKFVPGVSSYIRTVPMESLESVLMSVRDYTPK